MNPAVANAADRDQVKYAARKDKELMLREERDLQAVLKLPEGRRLLFRVLTHCKVFESIWHPSALIHANAGRQDVGHAVMAWINDADPEALFIMMKESRAVEKRDDAERKAVQQSKEDTST